MFTENFRKLVDESVYSQHELAPRLKVSQQTVSQWYTGKNYPRMEQLQRIASCFGVSMASLVGDTDVLKDEIIESLNELSKADLKAVYDFIKGIR